MLKAQGLEYEPHGEGEPVLLIHGSHVADSFLPLTREVVLADRYRLIRYHRRGFAGSSAKRERSASKSKRETRWRCYKCSASIGRT